MFEAASDLLSYHILKHEQKTMHPNRQILSLTDKKKCVDSYLFTHTDVEEDRNRCFHISVYLCSVSWKTNNFHQNSIISGQHGGAVITAVSSMCG